MMQDGPVKFEIVVKREKNAFKATCSMFPEVSGVGNDEAKAIEALADGLADKMGAAVKTALNDVLKKKNDFLCSSKSAAYTASQLPLPLVDLLLRGTHIRLDKTYPVLRGLLLILGLRAVRERNCSMSRLECFTPELLEEMEDRLFNTMLESGVFDAPQCSECRTPFGLILTIPLSFN